MNQFCLNPLKVDLPILSRQVSSSRFALSQRRLSNLRVSKYLSVYWPSLLRISHQSSREESGQLLAQRTWAKEWKGSEKGSITRAFFPTPQSRGWITDLDLSLSFPLTKVAPDIFLLNSHQQ